MTILSDKDRTRQLLMNWRLWSRDCPPDAAEVHYYTVSPMFQGVIKRGGSQPYDVDSALMVEEVMRRMFKPYPKEYRVLQAYYGESRTQIEIAKEIGVARTTVTRYRLPMAERIFGEQWAEMIRL